MSSPSTTSSHESSSARSRFRTVNIIGLGYIGLPAAVFFASRGARVFGVDIDAERVRQVNAGISPFHEPGFEDELAKVVEDGSLSAQTELRQADAHVIAVPTPFGEDYTVDVTHINNAARNVAKVLTGGELIVLESTVSPGTTQQMADLVLGERPDLTLEPHRPNSVYFAHAPERVLPGRIMIEMAENSRVIGGLNPAASALASDLYSMFSNGELLSTDARTAEMVKLTENAFRDVNIAFANELSIVCDSLGIDVWELIRLANHHPRVKVLQPGPGVGGHCIAVDPWFIVSTAPDETPLIRMARQVNDSKPGHVAEQAINLIAGLDSPVIVCLGLAFKANVSDTRGSPAVTIAATIATALPNAQIYALDPYLTKLPDSLTHYPNVTFTDEISLTSTADLCLFLVDHDHFCQLNLAELEPSRIIDTRGTTRKNWP